MRKIKILHLIKSLGRGGAEVLLPETLKLHDQDRFQFYYIYFLPWKDQMVEKIIEAGGVVHCIPARDNLQLLRKGSQVLRFCRENQIDLIHSHLPWSGFLSRVVHIQSQIPVVYTEHNIQERYHFITRYVNKYTFNWQTGAIGVSEDVTRSIVTNIKPKIPVRTVPNGVNTSFYRQCGTLAQQIRRDWDLPQDAIVFGNIAVFRKQKNIPLWIEAFDLICQKHQNVYGLLIGAGPEEEKIKNMVKDLGLEEKIKLPGLKTDTIPFYSAMDIFMMTSDFEGLPVALLEAMSMECAIISTKAGGVPEVVDNDNGFLCDVGDVYGLTEKAGELINNPEKIKRLGFSAREKVLQNFSLSSMVASLEEEYNKVIS